MMTKDELRGTPWGVSSRVWPTATLCMLVLELLFAVVPQHASAYELCFPPNAVRPGDPDPEAFDDPVLQELYRDTQAGIRTIAERPVSPERTQAMLEFKATPKSPEQIDYIVSAAAEAVKLGQWERYRAALWSTEAGVGGEPRLVVVAREALQAPRGEKLSHAQGRAIRETLESLGRWPCQEAADLLSEAVSEEFWGEEPMRAEGLAKDTSQSITMVRSGAIASLGCLPAAFSLPVLEKLAEQYPDIVAYSAPSDQYRFELGAGYAIAEAIYQVKTREGIPGAVNPLEIVFGKLPPPVLSPPL